jgi:hypothetical protein
MVYRGSVGIARISALLLLLAACANAGEAKPDGNTPIDSPPGDVGGATSHCNPGEFATSVAPGNQVVCAPIETVTRTAVDDHCSIYAGWNDSCDGCVTSPAKWGFAGGDRCINGLGGDDTCTTPNLGGQTVRMFGLNTDGDVNGDDKLHISLHCKAASAGGSVAPCPAGELVVGSNGTTVRCAPLAPSVVDYVATTCQIYYGWQDGCDGCVNPPVKWGHAGDGGCTNGIGADSTCGQFTLDGEVTKMFGLNPDGDFDENDKLHVGIRCGVSTPAQSTTMTMCPAGQFVVGVGTDGSYQCESPAPAIEKHVTERCNVFLGWSDNCDACTTPPTKWGKARMGACQNGIGTDNTCTTFTLGGDPVAMFGLSTDGDVDGNDTVFVGFTCR